MNGVVEEHNYLNGHSNGVDENNENHDNHEDVLDEGLDRLQLCAR